MGTHPQRNYYELLSAIAPTVLIDFHEVKDYQERLRYLAQILGKNARAEEILNQYQERIQELQQQLGERLEKVTISVIYLQEKQIFSTYGPSSPLVSMRVIQDIGLNVTLAQQHNSDFLQHSIETLPDHDADVLFVMTYRTRDNPEPYSFLQQPIWSQLKAVQNQQVYEVNWHVGGPLGANRVIDDLFKYLVSTP